MTKPRVYVTRRILEPGLSMVAEACDMKLWPNDEETTPRDVLLREVADCEGLLCVTADRIDAEVMDAAPNLRVISVHAVGVDNVDVQAATKRGIPVGNTPGVLVGATADLAFGLMLAVSRRIVEGAEMAKNGEWKTWYPKMLLGQDVYDMTLGVVGFGPIGQAMARRARGFNMKILYNSRTRKPEAEAEIGAEYVSLDELLERSDYVSLHVALTPETKHLINRERLQQMKRNAYLINTARGPVVDQDALIRALQEGIIAGAALDVTTPEPLPVDNPLFKMPNVVITPHIGSASFRARAGMAERAAVNLIACLNGEPLVTTVNPQVSPKKARTTEQQ